MTNVNDLLFVCFLQDIVYESWLIFLNQMIKGKIVELLRRSSLSRYAVTSIVPYPDIISFFRQDIR